LNFVGMKLKGCVGTTCTRKTVILMRSRVVERALVLGGNALKIFKCSLEKGRSRRVGGGQCVGGGGLARAGVVL